MAYSFENLRVWHRALDYDDLVCRIANALPGAERFGLADQLRRSSLSIALNIAEGSTSQTDREKNRFLVYAIRSLLETVAAQHVARRRGYRIDAELMDRSYRESELLFRELQAFRASVIRRLRARKRGGG